MSTENLQQTGEFKCYGNCFLSIKRPNQPWMETIADVACYSYSSVILTSQFLSKRGFDDIITQMCE